MQLIIGIKHCFFFLLEKPTASSGETERNLERYFENRILRFLFEDKECYRFYYNRIEQIIAVYSMFAQVMKNSLKRLIICCVQKDLKPVD